MRGKITRTFLTTKFSIAPIHVIDGVPSFNMGLKEDHEIEGGYSEEEVAELFPRLLKKKGMWGLVGYVGVTGEKRAMSLDTFIEHSTVVVEKEGNE